MNLLSKLYLMRDRLYEHPLDADIEEYDDVIHETILDIEELIKQLELH